MKHIFCYALAALMTLPVAAEETARENSETTRENFSATSSDSKIDMENGVLGIADNRGFTLQSKDGRFVFKPYLFIQTRALYNYYDDEGLDKAYNQWLCNPVCHTRFHGQDVWQPRLQPQHQRSRLGRKYTATGVARL